MGSTVTHTYGGPQLQFQICSLPWQNYFCSWQIYSFITKLAFYSNNYFLPRPHLPWLTKLFIHVKFIRCHGKTVFIHDKVIFLQSTQFLFAVAKLFFHEKLFRDVTNFRVVSKLPLGHDETFYESWQNSLIHRQNSYAIMTIIFDSWQNFFSQVLNC